MKTDSKKKRGSRSVETASASSVSSKQKPGKKLPKIFVLDTNVLLHDYRSLYKFQDNDIVIPLVDLDAETYKVAQRIANQSKMAVEVAKQVIKQAAANAPLEAGLVAEAQSCRMCLNSEDFKSALSDFIEKHS